MSERWGGLPLGEGVTMPAVAVSEVSFSRAIDAFVGDLARRGRSQATRASYRRLLNRFADAVHDKPVDELQLADYEAFLDRWTDSSPSTLASGVSLVRAFSRFAHERGWPLMTSPPRCGVHGASATKTLKSSLSARRTFSVCSTPARTGKSSSALPRPSTSARDVPPWPGFVVAT